MTIRPLNNEEKSALESGLTLAARIADKPQPLSVADVQFLCDSFIDEKISDEEAIIGLGLSFGQLIVMQAGYEWVRVEDEYGQETCVAPKGAKINCGPISMIQKRLDTVNTIDIEHLVTETINTIDGLIDSGNYEAR